MAAARTPSPGGTDAAAARVDSPAQAACRPANACSGADFSSVRAEFGLPRDYPAEALSEAEQAVAEAATPSSYADATDLPLVTIDPAGAKDLDQAVLIRRRRRGYRVHYAIADVAAFVPIGGALDRESRCRGQTLYLPDGNIPLHPTLLSEGAASLLPDQVRPAVLWTIDLDRDGIAIGVDVRRAKVRSVAALDYESVQHAFEAGVPPPPVSLLFEVGRLRRQQTANRGAIELGLPEQQVESCDAGHWRLVLRPRLPLEAFNAEISLLTGMCAAEIMLAAGTGILRTVPEPESTTVGGLRRSAARLGVDWPDGQPAAEFLAGLDPVHPEALALHAAATRLLRGAGYTAFEGGAPANYGHAGIGAAYAHVTAPLRRLVDRFCGEICLAVAAGREIPAWVVDALAGLPSSMGASDRLAAQVERACIAQVQAWQLRGRVGERFGATVLRANGGDGEVFLAELAMIARCVGDDLVEGSRVWVRLVEADPVRREVRFEVANHTPL